MIVYEEAVVESPVTEEEWLKQYEEGEPDDTFCVVCGETNGLTQCEGPSVLGNTCRTMVCQRHRKEFHGWCQMVSLLCPKCYSDRVGTPPSSHFGLRY